MVCSCLNAYGSYADFSYTTNIKARKTHKCVNCGDTINRGDYYERCSGKWEGDMYTFKTCLRCVEIRSMIYCERGGYEIEFIEDLFYILADENLIPWHKISKLSNTAREYICKLIETVWNKEEQAIERHTIIKPWLEKIKK